MNIVLITEDFPPMVGGIAVFLSELSSGLTKRGNDVRILANEMPGSIEFDQNQIYSIIRYRMPKHFSSLYIGWHLLKQIIRKKPDVLFLGHETATRGLPVLLFHWLFRIPYVILIHAAGNLHKASIVKINKIAVYTLLHNATMLLANSKYTCHLLIERGFQDEKIRVLNPGVDTDFFSPLNDESIIRETRSKYGIDRLPLILNVGRLVPKKNQVRIIKAIAKLREQGQSVKCIIAGEGPEQADLKKHIEEFGIGKQVLLIGNASREEVRELLQAADIVALPSIVNNGDYESFGMVALEASTCGRPVIVGSQGGQGDAVIPDKTGLVVDAEDENSIAKALSYLIEKEEFADRMGKAGRKHAVENFSWDKIAELAGNMLSCVIK